MLLHPTSLDEQVGTFCGGNWIGGTDSYLPSSKQCLPYPSSLPSIVKMSDATPKLSISVQISVLHWRRFEVILLCDTYVERLVSEQDGEIRSTNFAYAYCELAYHMPREGLLHCRSWLK